MINKTLLGLLMYCAIASSAVAESHKSEDSNREGGLTGTGILGEITALSSIIVNNQRIVFESDLNVSTALAPKQASDLVPGDVVAVAVTLSGDVWEAEAIRDVHPLIGPVGQAKDDYMLVLGVPVLWPEGTEKPAQGTWVAVSGFWARDVVVATRIQLIAARDAASMQGSYHLGQSGDTPMLGSIELGIDPLQHAAEGDIVRVQGPWVDGRIDVRDVHLGLFDHPVSLVLAEGYLTDIAPTGHYTVSGSGLSSYTETGQLIMDQNRITVCGLNGALLEQQERRSDRIYGKLGCPAPE